MQFARRSPALLTGVVLSTAALAMACGSSNSNKNTGSTVPPSASASAAAGAASPSSAKPSTPAATSAAAAGAKPADLAADDQQKLTIRITEPEFLDPHQSEFEQDIAVEHLLFRGLFTFDKNNNPTPALAVAVPSKDNGGLSADGLTYTIKLKTGQKFSDGNPLTAKDMEYSLKRELDPKIAGSYAGFYYDIKGGMAYNTALGTKDNPKSPSDADLKALRDAMAVKAMDDTTLQIQLTAPSASFLQRLSIWGAYPVEQAVVEKFGDKAFDAGNLVGNGPFLLKERVEKDHITLIANPAYTLDPKPFIKTLNLKVIDDGNQAVNAYKNGELDITDVPGSLAGQILTDPSLKDQVKQQARQNSRGIEFNNAAKPWDNAKVRLAFAKAIDRDALAQVVFNGIVKPGNTWLPPGLGGYDQANEQYQKYDVKAAQQLLADAGYPNGQGFPTDQKIILTDTPTNKALFDFLSKQLKDNLNVTIQADIVDGKTRSSRYTNKQFQLYWGGWNGDYPNADDWTNDLWTTGGSTNKPSYSDPAFDAAVKTALAETDLNKQNPLWAAADKIMLQDAALGVMYHELQVQLFKPKVKGMSPALVDSGWYGESLFETTYVSK